MVSIFLLLYFCFATVKLTKNIRNYLINFSTVCRAAVGIFIEIFRVCIKIILFYRDGVF